MSFDFSDTEIENVSIELGLPKDAYVDKESERRMILDCWDNSNIVACPGSGKSTVLLAKLILLSKRMPLLDGAGICVLTHTNVAIDEIKDKIGNKSDSLFSYPNFFGTIQSFIGKFILKKALYHFYRSKVTVVDTGIYNNKLFLKFNSLTFESSLRKIVFFKLYSSKVLVKDIIKECFGNSKPSKGEKSNNAKAKDIISELKTKKIISNDGHLNYAKCNKLSVSDCPCVHGKQSEIFKYLTGKHSDAKKNANNIESRKKFVESFRLDLNDGVYYFDGHRERKLAGKNTESYSQFKMIKDELFNEGVVSFSDAFDISKRYVEENLSFSELISCRFKYLFIDEMQDTQKEQIDLLDLLFNQHVKKQFFGDPDQAIFDSGATGKISWCLDSTDFKKFFISDSMRFGNNISSCINPFKCEIDKVEGVSKVQCGKPILLLYESTDGVLDKFSEIIKAKGLLENDIYKSWNKASEPFNAVGFVGKSNDKKVTIGSYYPEYDNYKLKKSRDHSNLISYFQKESTSNFETQGTSIYMNKFKRAYVRALNEQGAHESSSQLINTLKSDEEFYEDFLYLCMQWIEKIHFKGISPQVVKEEFLSFLKRFNLTPNITTHFFTNQEIEVCNFPSNSDGFYSFDEGKVKLGTIHSVKGETHMATLLLECMNKGKSESHHFFNKEIGHLFCGQELQQSLEELKEPSRRLKTTYVALSRPSHLLCVALNKEHVNCIGCTTREQCNWEVELV